MNATIATVVTGASGYVGGELLRLIAGHPHFRLAAAISSSRCDQPLTAAFGHLAPAYAGVDFTGPDRWLESLTDEAPLAVFSAAPHGASAAMLDELLDALTGRRVHVVDVSADYRFAEREAYERVYGRHGAPARLGEFFAALPEHVRGTRSAHVGHPGCFATAMLLVIVPLLARELTSGAFRASGVTGSTGSGRSPVAGTHHPERHGNLYAYKALAHRHAPEVLAIAKTLTGADAELHFVPHSGPFARGIHMTVFASLAARLSAGELRQTLADYYAAAEFVAVVDGSPRLKNVVASNYAEIGVAVAGREAVLTVALDNLVKGAAGGAVQWMNRLFGLDDTAGLKTAAPAWT